MNQVFHIVPASSKVLWFLGAIAVFLIALAVFLGYIGYSSRHVTFVLEDGALNIRGDIYGRTIPLESIAIEDAQQIDLDRRSPYYPKWRTNGAGLPGYRAGWFKLNNGEKALLFVTQNENVLYLPTDDNYAVMASVAEPEEFLRSLRATIEQ